MGQTLDNFNPYFVAAYNALASHCGGDPASMIGSGYRTIDEQRGLLYKRAQGISVADPGTSRHEGNHGGAVDVQFPNDQVKSCMHEHANEYGLGFDVEGEDWHIQFSAEGEAAALDGTFTDKFGISADGEQVMPGQPTEQPDTLDSIRDIIMGGSQQMDVPEKVAQGLSESEHPVRTPTAATGDDDGFTPQASAGFSSDGSSLSAVDVAKYYAQAGFTGDALVTMVAIAKGESGWNPVAKGDVSIAKGDWGPSIGLSQIRSLNSQSGTGGWRDPQRLSDPLFNARAAYAISNGGTNFGPWTVYSKGIYQQYVEEAKKAVVALGSGSYAPAGAPPPASVAAPDEEGINPDFGLTDPVGMGQEIADMLLRARKGPEQVLDRVKPDEEDDKPEPRTSLIGDG